MEESSSLRRFLDPNLGSSLTDNEIVEHDSREFERVRINGVGHAEHILTLQMKIKEILVRITPPE
jgi:hypothetical protein